MASTTTKISWTDATWNPVHGCSKVSPGCAHCYAETLSRRYGFTKHPWMPKHAEVNVRTRPDKLGEPLKWKEPRRVFVNSMSDLFHDNVPDEFICRVFGTMAAASQHIFQVLTKRPERMRRLLSDVGFANDVAVFAEWDSPTLPWPLPNVWLGVSVEHQRFADERVTLLQATPATVRFLSCEPLLGPLNLRDIIGCCHDDDVSGERYYFKSHSDPMHTHNGIDWVIIGGESGKDFRPMNLEWLTEIADLCQEANVPVFVKQDSQFRNEQWGRIPEAYRLRQFPQPAVARPQAKEAP